MQWEIAYAELTNKIRWAISTTANSLGMNIPFREAMGAASPLAADLLEEFKMKHDKPDYQLASRATSTSKGGSGGSNNGTSTGPVPHSTSVGSSSEGPLGRKSGKN